MTGLAKAVRFGKVSVGWVFRVAEPWLAPAKYGGAWIKTKAKTRHVDGIGKVVIANAKRATNGEVGYFNARDLVKIEEDQ